MYPNRAPSHHLPSGNVTHRARPAMLVLILLLMIPVLLIPATTATQLVDDQGAGLSYEQSYSDPDGDVLTDTGQSAPYPGIDLVECCLASDNATTTAAARMVGDVDPDATLIFQCLTSGGDDGGKEFIFTFDRGNFYFAYTDPNTGRMTVEPVYGEVDHDVVRIHIENEQLDELTGGGALTLRFVNATLQDRGVYDNGLYTLKVDDMVSFDAVRIDMISLEQVNYTFVEHHSDGSPLRATMDLDMDGAISIGERRYFEEKMSRMVNNSINHSGSQAGADSDTGGATVDLDADILVNGMPPTGTSVVTTVEAGSDLVHSNTPLSLTTLITYHFRAAGSGEHTISFPTAFLLDNSSLEVPGLELELPAGMVLTDPAWLEPLVHNGSLLLTGEELDAEEGPGSTDRLELTLEPEGTDDGSGASNNVIVPIVILAILALLVIGYIVSRIRQKNGEERAGGESFTGQNTFSARGGRREKGRRSRKRKG